MLQFYELVRELAGLGKDAGEATLKKANRALHRYLSFLKSVSVGFAVFLAFVAVLFVFGSASDLRPVISLATFLAGVATFFWLLAIFPIIWAVQKGMEWESVRKTFEWIGIATLWIFFLSIYFYLVPVPLAAIPLVLVLAAGIAVASVVFGVGVSTRFIALRLGIVFTVVTVFFVLTAVFPSSFGGVGKLIAWLDSKFGGTVIEVVKPLPQVVAYSPDLVFFDPRTREPMIWYYRVGDKAYELYDASGFHPRYQEELGPITPEIVRELEEMERAAKEELKNKIAEDEERARKAAEEKRIADLERAIQDAKAKANEATKIAKIPGPRGPQGPPGLTGTPGQTGPQGPEGPKGPDYAWVSIPAGTKLVVFLNQDISTEKNKVGDTFSVEVAEAVRFKDQTIVPKRASGTGRITVLERPGRVSGNAVLSLVLTSISMEEGPVAAKGIHEVETEPLVISGQDSTGKDVAKVGIGAGIGAALGAILGGKEGAAKGAALGAGGGTAVAVSSRGQDIVLRPETKLEFKVAREVPLFEVVR